MRIKNKLITIFTSVNVFVFTLVIIANLITSDRKMEANKDRQLTETTQIVKLLVEGTIKNTAESYLNAASLSVLNMIKNLNQSAVTRNLGTEDLQTLTLKILSDMDLSGTGYIYITDNRGVVLHHPQSSQIGKKSVNSEWIQNNRYAENAHIRDNDNDSEIFLFKTRYQPWNWQIIFNAELKKFESLLDMEDLNKEILGISIGKTGYPMVVNKNGVVIVHPTINGRHVDTVTDADGRDFLKGIHQSEESGSLNYPWKEPDGRTLSKFAYHTHIPTTEWTLLITGYDREFEEESRVMQILLIVAAVIALLINIIVVIIVGRIITRPINSLSKSIKEISMGDGDLTRKVHVTSKDELRVMADDFNAFIDKLREMIIKIKMSTDNTLAIKDELTAGTEETTAALYQISKNMESINRQVSGLGDNMQISSKEIDSITLNINELNGFIESQASMIEQSTASVTEMISSVESVAQISVKKRQAAQLLVNTAKEGSKIVEETHKSVLNVSSLLQNINEMATIITGIASRTNLLAMNAAIEAAHAGEAGKGFAVVADEIRKLAESSNSNSTRIQQVLKEVAVSIEAASSNSRKTSESFYAIDREINGVVEALDEVYTSTDELQVGGQEILTAITTLRNLSNTVMENSVSITEASSRVNAIVNNTNNITADVVTAINEVNTGTGEISRSMSSVSENTAAIGDTGKVLSHNVNQFKTT